MEKVEAVLRRLESAVARLERALEGAGGDRGDAAAAQARYAALAETTDAVAQRLEAVIGRLDRVLEG